MKKLIRAVILSAAAISLGACGSGDSAPPTRAYSQPKSEEFEQFAETAIVRIFEQQDSDPKAPNLKVEVVLRPQAQMPRFVELLKTIKKNYGPPEKLSFKIIMPGQAEISALGTELDTDSTHWQSFTHLLGQLPATNWILETNRLSTHFLQTGQENCTPMMEDLLAQDQIASQLEISINRTQAKEYCQVNYYFLNQPENNPALGDLRRAQFQVWKQQSEAQRPDLRLSFTQKPAGSFLDTTYWVAPTYIFRGGQANPFRPTPEVPLELEEREQRIQRTQALPFQNAPTGMVAKVCEEISTEQPKLTEAGGYQVNTLCGSTYNDGKHLLSYLWPLKRQTLGKLLNESLEAGIYLNARLPLHDQAVFGNVRVPAWVPGAATQNLPWEK
ncbi:hypothetical protein BSR28_01250 [Boudabousia liubingyangii]|uniref:hypothetical protein n=1 Tax=Boudabousia liubingyangii TaxID=1921764 RepID=UPI00093B33F7|nr:hypothetical protein [Boudabousia liubingyangii]OKL48357.1 hypothetical protein BSR28_01250 [Boudabousia liubingyangii]